MKIRKPHRVALLALATVLLVLWTGLAAAEPAPYVVEAWLVQTASEEVLAQLQEAFNSTHDDVQVNITVMSWSTVRDKIIAGLSSGEAGPDVFYIQNGLDQTMLEAGVLVPASAYMTEAEMALYTDHIAINVYEGEIMALPLSYYTGLFYYRTDILAEYGFDAPPKDWDEWYRVAETITTQSNGEIMGFQLKGADDHRGAMHHTFLAVYGAAGGTLLDADGYSKMNCPEGIAALEFMGKFYQNGVSTIGPSAVTGFAEGNIAMFHFNQDVPGTNKWYENPDIDGKWATSLIPMGAVSNSGYLGGQAVAVNANSKNIQAAGTFAKWYAAPQNTPYFMAGTFGVPPYQIDALDADSAAAIRAVIDEHPEYWESIYESFDNTTVDLALEDRISYNVRNQAMQAEFIAYLMGEISAEEALDNVDARVDESLF